MAKLKDIAEALDVSVVTVSNALSGKKGVSDAVRQEVLEKAKELGYNVSKYEVKKTGNYNIGVIVSEQYLGVGNSFYWDMYQQAAYAAAKKNCFTMFEILEKNIPEPRKLPDVLTKGEIDGLLVIGWVEHSYIKRVLRASKVPIVLLDFYHSDFSCDAIMSNNYIGMYKATRYLLERGHREIAFVGSVNANDNIRDRYFGYRKALEEWQIPLREDWILEDRDVENWEMRLQLPESMPTAFACNSDFSASFLYDMLQEKGYRIPEDISIVGYDNYLYGHSFADEITTYNVDVKKMAQNAVGLLLKKIGKNDKYQGVRYLDSVIVERSSVKKLDKLTR